MIIIMIIIIITIIITKFITLNYIMPIVKFTLFTGFLATHLAIMMLTQLALCPSTGHFWFL